VNLFLQLRVSDESNSKFESIDLSSSEMQFLSHRYNTQAEICKDDRHVNCAPNPSYTLAKKDSSIYGFLKLVLLLIDSVLRVGDHLSSKTKLETSTPEPELDLLAFLGRSKCFKFFKWSLVQVSVQHKPPLQT
jgi:hypothetical protein